jgi:hypothetical protein
MTDAPTPMVPDDGSPLASRKFLISLLFALTGCAALFFAKIDAQSFNWLVGIILIGHSGGNILDKKLNGV